MKKYLIFFVLILASFGGLKAQNYLLEEEVKDYGETETKGPNAKTFTHFYQGFGFLFGENQAGSAIRMPASFYYELGFRWKYKLNNFLALGYSGYNRFDFNYLKQETGKLLPTPTLHDREGLYFYKLGIEPYIRINVNKRRGNFMGTFIDLGARANWNWLVVNEIKDVSNNLKITSTITGYDFYNPFNIDAVARLGLNKISFIFTYRLNAVMKSSSGFADLPVYSLGILLSQFSN